MSITQAMCTSFKVEILKGVHNFTASSGNTFNLALYAGSPSPALGAATTGYQTDGEISGTGYTAKGAALTSVTPVASGTTAIGDFNDLTFSSSTITASGALIFNDTVSGDPSVAVLSFGGDKTSTNGDFTIVFPTADASNAIIRIA
tara:strand:+ start:19847 stop:20284 length:438 start_codon:yes stop_codon:yes gene_type:complete